MLLLNILCNIKKLYYYNSLMVVGDYCVKATGVMSDLFIN